MGFEQGGVVVRGILVLWVFWVGRMVRGIGGDTNVPRGGVGGDDNVGIGRNDNLSSNVPIGSNLCRRFFCGVFQGWI